MQDEANQLIRSLLDPERTLADDERKQVLDHLREAPFASRTFSIKRELQGKMFMGRMLRTREPSLIAHLAKRVLWDLQWALNTTPSQYLADLHGVVGDRELRMAVFQAKDGRIFLGLLAPNRLPQERLGLKARPFLWVLYSSDHGTITSGYQVTSVATIALPETVRWV